MYDCTTGALGFDPRTSATDFNCLFALHGGWGEYRQTGLEGLASGMLTLQCIQGSVSLTSLSVASTASSVSATLDGQAISVSLNSSSSGINTIKFAALLSLKQNSVLWITLGTPGDAVIAVAADLAAPLQCCPAQKGCCDGSNSLRQRVSSAKSVNQSDDVTVQPRAAEPTTNIMLLVVVALMMFLLGAVFGGDLKMMLLQLFG